MASSIPNIPTELPGLNTQSALEGLRNILHSYENTQYTFWNCIKSLGFWKCILHHNSCHTTFSWIPAGILTVFIIILLYLQMWTESVILLSVVTLNMLLVIWDNYLRLNELNRRIRFISNKLKRFCNTCDWNEQYFPHSCTPNAPSVSLQWTVRDGRIVNLPTILLTTGDIIVMRPGQQSPVECYVAQKDANIIATNGNLLTTDEIFSCHGSLYKLEQPNSPTIRRPLPNKLYRVTTPPIVTHLELLKRRYLLRPFSLYSRAKHLLFGRVLFHYLLPISVILVGCISFIRWMFIPRSQDSLLHVFVIEQGIIILSLMPFAFPLLWLLIHIVGNAFLLSCSDIQRTSKNILYNTESVEAQIKDQEVKVSWKHLSSYCWDIMFGKGATITRSSNLLHNLASVTSLCCVDKKGILSWPNPTAEKLFFLHDVPKPASASNVNENVSEISKTSGSYEKVQEEKQSDLTLSIEILDLTHDSASAWKLQFDDVNWHRYLSSLKPLGLAILLNTCNPKTHEYYSQFCAHITCQALFSEHLVPVANRRCLCELARIIGFKENASSKFDTDLQLFTYRNVGDIIEMDTKYMKTFFKRRKMKFPFPHMMSVIVKSKKETMNGSMRNGYSSRGTHLFSQGTADIILDGCVDYWSGSDIIKLTPSARNKILDFYQRSSLTAYCSAFSYRPVLKRINKNFANIFVELPRDKMDNSSNSSSISSAHAYSVDNDSSEVRKTINGTECYKSQCDQIFLGMVSMQYQALADMVQLVEELDKACIRFVHFSKENELRSRVFSEKMGLESGWNCHISLLDTNRDMFSESVACLENINYAYTDFNASSSNNSFRSYKVISSREDSPSNFNADTVSSRVTEARKQRQSLDQSSESDVSYTGEESVPLGFDMSNRSKLPRGIDNIRPHLQEVDNVPLLVSLFTDCTPEATREMISIMQENGEVVIVLGSSANMHNVGIFVQADSSIAIDPLYPQVCQREPAVKFSADNTAMTPLQLCQLLNSIGCSFTIRREDPLPIFHLILKARHIMQHVWNCMQFWLCCMTILTVTQLIALIFMLPPMFTIEQILWITCIVIPLLSVTLLNGPVDKAIMDKATGKDWLCSPSTEIILYLLWCYGAKLLVAIFSTSAVYGALLYSLCHQYSKTTISNNNVETVKCSYVYLNEFRGVHSQEYVHVLFFTRHATSLMLILHYVALCASFLFRAYPFWKKIPFLSITWTLSVTLILVAQLIYILNYEVHTEHIFNVDMPPYLIAYFVVSPLLTFVICEMIKLYEIRSNKRYHRKVRLMFGTKLGMNSPF